MAFQIKNKLNRGKASDNAEWILTDKSPWPIQEAYKALRTNITFSLPGSGCKVIGVTSAFRHDGKSTNAVNAAISFCQIDKKVALIEGDLRLPTLSKKLGCRSIYRPAAFLEDKSRQSWIRSADYDFPFRR